MVLSRMAGPSCNGGKARNGFRNPRALCAADEGQWLMIEYGPCRAYQSWKWGIIGTQPVVEGFRPNSRGTGPSGPFRQHFDQVAPATNGNILGLRGRSTGSHQHQHSSATESMRGFVVRSQITYIRGYLVNEGSLRVAIALELQDKKAILGDNCYVGSPPALPGKLVLKHDPPLDCWRKELHHLTQLGRQLAETLLPGGHLGGSRGVAKAQKVVGVQCIQPRLRRDLQECADRSSPTISLGVRDRSQGRFP